MSGLAPFHSLSMVTHLRCSKSAQQTVGSGMREQRRQVRYAAFPCFPHCGVLPQVPDDSAQASLI